MTESDILQILLSHDRWATAQLLGACGNLTGDQFHRRFDIGPGSLHDTLTHILGAMRSLTETLAGQALRPRLEDGAQPPHARRVAWAARRGVAAARG